MHKFPIREVLLTVSLVFTIIALTGCDLSEGNCDDSSYKELPSWSPDGTKIAFSSDGRVHVINADGTGRVDLTKDWGINWSSGSGTSHSWSPDGTKIVFEYPPIGRASGRGDIHVMNVDGTGHLNLTANNIDIDCSPSWSPDGTKITFASSRHDASGRDATGIYVMNTDGTDQVKLTSYQDPLSESSPSWSPDGAKIAFKGYSTIYVMNADGTDLINLVDLTDYWIGSDVLSWSPDGTKIAFECFEYDGVCVMNADGRGEIEHLTEGLTECYSPSWSPDGTKIAFLRRLRECAIEPKCSLHVMNADGTNEKRLVK